MLERTSRMMNFKIEFNYLNIDNYPSIESHLEKMAKKGWLLRKIFMGTLFLYKKIEPTTLDFSISPYEVETFFTRKSKADLEEFQTVSENVGWNYVDRSYDLYIYYKSEDTNAVPMHTDDEEEFKLLERIAKRYLRSQYILFPLIILISWGTIGSIFNNVRPMKDGWIQPLAVLLPFICSLSLIQIVDLRKFIKTNRENIEQGRRLTFNSTNQWIYKTNGFLFFLVFLILAVYTLYSIFILKNSRVLTMSLPIVAGVIIGLMYRLWIKPLRQGLGFKLGSFLLTLLIAGLVGAPLGMLNFKLLTSSQELIDPNDYQVLMLNDFIDEEVDEQGNLTRDISFLIPDSHEYTAHFGSLYIRTEYSNALNESLAENLVGRYIKDAKNRLRGNYSQEIDQSFSEGEYHPDLKSSGLTEHDFNRLYNEEANSETSTVWNLINSQSITETNQLWNVDEAYYLSYEKDEVLLRDGKEVFYIEGIDFSDPDVVKQAKVQLQLNE